MAEFGRGIKAGIVSGVIYAIVSAIVLSIVVFAVFDWLLSSYTGTGFGYFMMGSFGATVIITGIVIGTIIWGIIAGIIFGLIYAAVYNSLPGSTSGMKGIVLAIIAWLIFSVGLGWGSIVFGYTYFAITIITGLILWIFWGYLLGKFWDKFGGKPQTTAPAP